MSYFITLEGIEGSGKSTLQNSLADYLRTKGHEVVLTREPGATSIGQAIRGILLDPKNQGLASLTELALFAADRAQHVAEIIRPALARGAWVVSDRYSHSTIAYQGYGRKIPLDTLGELNELATGGLRPDLVLLLDLNPEQGLARARERAEIATNGQSVNPPDSDRNEDSSWTRFEEEELAFHQRVRQGYLELAKVPENRFVVIDAGQSLDQVTELAIAALSSLPVKK